MLASTLVARSNEGLPGGAESSQERATIVAYLQTDSSPACCDDFVLCSFELLMCSYCKDSGSGDVTRVPEPMREPPRAFNHPLTNLPSTSSFQAATLHDNARSRARLDSIALAQSHIATKCSYGMSPLPRR